MAFFDAAASVTGLLHTLREEAGAYQEALSDKLGSFVQGLACFVGGMVSPRRLRCTTHGVAKHRRHRHSLALY